MTSPHAQQFQDWLESGADAAGAETFFLYHNWLEQLSLPVACHRPTGELIYFNPAFAQLVGRRRRDLLGHHLGAVIAEIVPGLTDWGENYFARVAEATTENSSFRTELDLSSSSGERFELGWLVSVQFDLEDNPGLVWALGEDIAEQKRLERAMHTTNLRLAESNRDLEDFAYVASHDLQEPLRKIQAFGDRLESRLGDDADPKVVDYLDRMLDASGRMQRLIDDLLTYSRVSTQGRPLAPIDLSEVVRGVLGDLEVAIANAGAEITVADLPMVVNADETQMRQLFQNLVGNALKFRDPETPVSISIEAAMLGQTWLISVRDNGIGFDQAYAEKIFTVFQRLHGRSAYEGSGVGLSVCRKIAERHNGSIAASSAPGDGATFTLQIPRHVSELPTAA